MIIIGAGISGLSLAFFLQKNGYDCIILEKDNDIIGKQQGFSLTMQGETYDIFKKYNLLEEMYEYGSEVKEKIYYNNDGKIIYKSNNNKFNYPLPRQNLREMFYDKLKKNTVAWNTKVIDIKKEDDVHKIKCIIGNENKLFETKLLFVCSGINNIYKKLNDEHNLNVDIRISKQSTNNLNDLKLMNIYGIVAFNKLSNDTKLFFKNKTLQILDGHHRFFSKPFNKDYQMYEFTYPSDDNKLYKEINLELCLSNIINEIKDWKIDHIKELITATKIEDVIVHPLYDHIPDLKDVENYIDIVFLGDSIHPMSPYRGLGANNAIIDAYNFVKSLLSEKDILNVIKVYNKEMVERNIKYVELSRKTTTFLHSSDATNEEKIIEFKNKFSN